MATIMLEYDARNITFKKMIEVLVSLGAKATPIKKPTHPYSLQARKTAVVKETHIPNEETIQAIEEARAGKVTRFKSADDLIAYMNAL